MKILSGFEDTVVNRPLDTQSGTHLDHSLTNAHRHLFALSGFVCDGDPIDQGIMQPPRLEMIRQNDEEYVATNIFLA